MLRIGYIFDGVFKALVSLATLMLFPLLVGDWGATAWLLCPTSVAVLASALAEFAYGMRVARASHIKYLVAYDAGWVLASIGAVLLVVSGSSHAWDLWFGYQLVFSPVIAVIFGLGARDRRSAEG